jgi:leucyl-tRNA synthetase
MYGTDATRVALADAGDQLDDANFVMDSADNAVLKLNSLAEWISLTLKDFDKLRTGESEDE